MRFYIRIKIIYEKIDFLLTKNKNYLNIYCENNNKLNYKIVQELQQSSTQAIPQQPQHCAG